MNLEEIDKWLDNEYGVSYTELEKIHDWLVDKNQAKDKEIERLNNIINELERHLEQQYLEWKDDSNDEICAMADEDKCILEKLRELKGDSSNGKTFENNG